MLSIALFLPPAAASGDVKVVTVASGLNNPRGIFLLGGRSYFVAEAGAGGYFDDGGFPVGKGWDEIAFPAVTDEHAYALEISGESMQPAYRDGDVIIVSPAAPVRRGDRVVVKTKNGEVMVKELKRQTAKQIELKSLNADHPERTLSLDDVVWIARIVWASQ